MKWVKIIWIIILVMVITTGCMYPQDRLVENTVPAETNIQSVQDAIDRFVEDTGLLPILNSEVSTPIYEKYVIDFSRLFPQYIGYIPGNAFEKGGPFRYVIVDPEENPTVRLMDLRISNAVREIQLKVNQYHFEKGAYPIGEKLNDWAYHIDYSALKVKPVYVISPFTGQNLPLYLARDGRVLVDYALDIGIFLNGEENMSQVEGDLRQILVNNSLFVPVKSLPYQLVNGEPMMMLNE